MLTAPLTRDGQVRLDERHLAALDRVDGARVDVDADDLDAAGGQDDRGRQADVAEADDGDAAAENVIHG